MAVVPAFVRCICGKIHSRSLLSPQTKCSCGRDLYGLFVGR